MNKTCYLIFSTVLAATGMLVACQQNTPATPGSNTPATLSASAPSEYLEFSTLSELQKHAGFPIWIPGYIPGHLPLYRAWIARYATGDENVRLLYSEPGNSLDASLKSLDIQMTRSDEMITSDSIAHQFRITPLDVRQIRVRGQSGFTYWAQSGAAGNSAHLDWREGAFNFSITLYGDWPAPDRANPHALDALLFKIAASLQSRG